MKTYYDLKPVFPRPKIDTDTFYLTYPCFAELKLDGELNYFDGYRLINTYGRAREDLPITKELKGKAVVLIGELFYGEGTSFYDEILSHKTSDDLQFYVFDIAEVMGKDISSLPFIKRREILTKTIKESEHIVISTLRTINSEAELIRYFVQAVSKGYEGIVAKNINSPLVNGNCKNWVKLKKEETLDVAVLGVKKDKDALAIGYLPNIVIGAVGNKNSDLLGLLEEVKQKGRIVGEDREYYFTEPKYVIEVKHNGWIRGKTLRHPVFVRTRPDKSVEEIK